MAYGIVTKPIPGTGYGIGEPAIFSKEQEEKYEAYLAEGSYLKHISKAEYDKLVKSDEIDTEVLAAAQTSATVDENTVQLTKDQYADLLAQLEELKKAQTKADEDEKIRATTTGEKAKAAPGEKR